MHPNWVRGHAIGWARGGGRVSAAPSSGGAFRFSGVNLAAVFTRRAALGTGAVAVGALAVAAGAPAQAAPARGIRTAVHARPTGAAPDPALPVRSQFAGREGLAYQGASQWSAHRLVLERVGDLATPGGDPEHRYLLRFTTDGEARDGVYRLTAVGEPDAVLFLTRVGGEEPTLEAIVDRTEAAA